MVKRGIIDEAIKKHGATADEFFDWLVTHGTVASMVKVVENLSGQSISPEAINGRLKREGFDVTVQHITIWKRSK